MFDAVRIPDLLQTDGYAQAVNLEMHKHNPAEAAGRRVQLRVARRERLLERSNVPRLQVVIDEAVLRRRVGSEAVMRDQIEYLVKIAGRPGSEIQVLPLTAATSPTQESFRILHFSESDLRDVVYLERLEGANYLDKDQDVESYMRAMHQLGSRALSSEESVPLLQNALAGRASGA